MGITLHCGAKPTSEKQVKAIKATCKTKTHEALPHGEFIDMTRGCLSDLGIEAGEGTYGMSPCGEDMFGLIEMPRGLKFDRMEAIKKTLALPFSYEQACTTLVDAVREGIIPPGMLPPVISEWVEADSQPQREAFQQDYNANRLLQAFTNVNQKDIGRRARTPFATMDRMARRSKEFTTLLQEALPEIPEFLQGEMFEDENDSRYFMGLRNSNRMRFTAGWLLGEAPFICDNLAFMGEVHCDHKHTLNIHEELRERVTAQLTELITGNPANN